MVTGNKDKFSVPDSLRALSTMKPTTLKEVRKLNDLKVRKTLSIKKSTNKKLIKLYAELERQQSEIVDIAVELFDLMKKLLPENYFLELSEALLNENEDLAKTIFREAVINMKL